MPNLVTARAWFGLGEQLDSHDLIATLGNGRRHGTRKVEPRRSPNAEMAEALLRSAPIRPRLPHASNARWLPG
jgi:hypothetical protein